MKNNISNKVEEYETVLIMALNKLKFRSCICAFDIYPEIEEVINKYCDHDFEDMSDQGGLFERVCSKCGLEESN